MTGAWAAFCGQGKWEVDAYRVSFNFSLDFLLTQTLECVKSFPLTTNRMTTAKKKIGRPRLPRKQALGRVFGARFRAGEARVILDAIRDSGRPQAEWIRDALLSTARRASGR